jgi:hypothetical protein
MPDEVPKPKSKTCPHCGKVIPRLVRKPRDLGLLLNVLLYRVPVGAEVTEAWIEKARAHCHMKPERLAELRSEPHARHWPRMLERRAARLAYFKKHGELPPRWKGLLPGESDHIAQLDGLHRYRKGGLARLKARLRKHPDTAWAKLANRHLATRRIRSAPRRSAAVDDVMARLVAQFELKVGKLSLKDYEILRTIMLPDDDLPRRFRRSQIRKGLTAEDPEKNAGGELSRAVPRSELDEGGQPQSDSTSTAAR